MYRISVCVRVSLCSQSLCVYVNLKTLSPRLPAPASDAQRCGKDDSKKCWVDSSMVVFCLSLV